MDIPFYEVILVCFVFFVFFFVHTKKIDGIMFITWVFRLSLKSAIASFCTKSHMKRLNVVCVCVCEDSAVRVCVSTEQCVCVYLFARVYQPNFYWSNATIAMVRTYEFKTSFFDMIINSRHRTKNRVQTSNVPLLKQLFVIFSWNNLWHEFRDFFCLDRCVD